MDTKEVPPPYTPYLNAPPVTQFQDRNWVPSPVPVATFEPPYIMQQQPAPHGQPSTMTNVTVTGPVQVRGACPVCHGTSWTGSYPCCAWVLCILFFPIGILCCFCMRKKKCSKCGFTVG